jgi:protein-arginine kinase
MQPNLFNSQQSKKDIFTDTINPRPLGLSEFDNLDEVTRNQIKQAALENNIDLELIFASGNSNPDSSIGFYLSSSKAYQVLRPLILKVAEKYHNYKPSTKQQRDFNLTSLQDLVLDVERKYIISTRIRIARSLEEFPFTSAISKSQRKTLEKNIIHVLESLEGDLAGDYQPLSQISMSDSQKLINAHILFKSEDRFLESAGIYRDMPEGRGIFLANDNQFIIWVGEEDHLRIISLQNDADIFSVFDRITRALNILEKKIIFAFDEEFGYLNSCPTNIGTAMRASVLIKLPKISQRADFKELCKSMSLQARGFNGEHSDSSNGIYDISNIQRLGKSEKEIIEGLVIGIKKLIELESL